MNRTTFESLLKYYLSCMDAEEAMSLQLRKNQENKSYIFLKSEDALFSQDLPKLEISVADNRQRNFIERKSPDSVSLIDLQYGFPVFRDKKDMLSPLFFIEVDASFSDQSSLQLLPQIKTLSVNRMHFVKQYGAEETQRICEELEGEFGSFEARLKATEQYIPSLSKRDSDEWIWQPILFRSNFGGSRSGQRYDLTYLLKKDDAHTKETALKYLLDAAQNDTQDKTTNLILEIGALNDQQEEAVAKGLKEPLSVVTGPPGTGKTQVVTALLASAIYNNETVLFASNNNMPVDGVYERLGESTGYLGNWLIRLGNQEKRQECYRIITSLLERMSKSDLSEFAMEEDQETFITLEQEIAKTRSSLKKAHTLQAEISKLHEKENQIEQRLPEDWVQQFANIDPIALDSKILRKIEAHSRSGFLPWLRRKLFGLEKFIAIHNQRLTTLCGGNENLSEYESWLLIDENWGQALEKARKSMAYLRFHQDWSLAVQKRRRLEEKLKKLPSSSELFKLKAKKSEISQKLFEKWWLKDIRNSSHEAIEAFTSYFKDIENYGAGRHRRLMKSLNAVKRIFPIWITTNQSVSTIMPPEEGLFDLVVIDEAGQCDIPSVIPLLYRAKRAVIIGDPHQFKHITSIKDDIEHAISQKLNIEDTVSEWSFKHRSAFDRSAASTQSSILLKQHYRCHPDIIEFSNLNFYDGKLVKQVAHSHFQNKLPIEESGLIWHNTLGKAFKAPKGAWNPTEIEKTIETFEWWANQGLFADKDITYGVITPFRRQVDEMRKALSKCSWYNAVENRFTIGTAHSFQGSECDVLVYSPVVADGMADYLVKFAAEQKDLINVTVTRAKNLLYIIGDIQACQTASVETSLYQLASYTEHIRKQQKSPLNAAERAMASILDSLKLSYESQYEFAQYRLDFLLNAPSGQRYNIEVDGDIHLTAEAIKHDERRDAYVKDRDIEILRFSARDVIHHPDLIKERLMRI